MAIVSGRPVTSAVRLGRRPRHHSEIDVVATVPCAWCGGPRPLTRLQQQRGVQCHAGSCAVRWALAHAPRPRTQARQVHGGQQRGRVVREAGCRRTADELLAQLQGDQEAFFLRPSELARLRHALRVAYARGYARAWRSAWGKYQRQVSRSAA